MPFGLPGLLYPSAFSCLKNAHAAMLRVFPWAAVDVCVRKSKPPPLRFSGPPLTDLLHSMSFQTQQHWKKQPDSSTTNIEPYISQPLSASPFRKKKRKRITVQSSAICCDVCSRTHTLPSICSKVIEYQGNFPCGSGCTVNFTGKYLYEILDNISRPEEDDVAASSFVVPQMPYLNSYDERKKQFMYIMNTFI